MKGVTLLFNKTFTNNYRLQNIIVRKKWSVLLYSTNAVKYNSRTNDFIIKSNTYARHFSSSGSNKIQLSVGSRSPEEKITHDTDEVHRPMSEDDILPVPRETDILVIGGGAVGLSIAYWLKQRHPTGFTLTVVEQDPQYNNCSTTRAVGGIRQQFSLKENIQMSMFSAEFLRDLSNHLKVVGMDPPDVQFTPQGYLFLAHDDQASIMESNHKTQSECGAQVELMNKDLLSVRYPWMNCNDIALGSYGLQNEGWFDPWLLLASLKAKCIALGTKFVKGKVVDFAMQKQGMVLMNEEMRHRQVIQNAMIQTEDGKIHETTAAIVINSAGCWSKEVGLMANIGNGPGPLSTPIPVEKRKRFVFMFHCPNGPGLDMPMLIDPSGVYVRREGLGGHYICGKSPASNEEEPNTDSLDITESDYNLFYEQIWPTLANRIPAFENIKMKSAWAGFYDYNTMDQNLIIGNHPYHRKFYMACGSSGHGLQHSIAIGRAVMEHIIDDDFLTIDLSNFSFDRVLFKEPIYEVNIV